MARNHHIIDELTQMGSLLSQHQPGEIYQVPAGYFDKFPELMQFRVTLPHIMEDDLHKPTHPYKVPQGYFENLPQQLLNLVKEEEQPAEEELETLSPLLSSLKKENPYQVPAGYFEKLPQPKHSEAKVVSMGSAQKWMRYAAAAIVIGIIAISGVLFFNQNSAIDPVTNPQAWVQQKTKKISNDELESFIELANIETNAIHPNIVNPVKEAELKELLEDVPETEINNFLNETSGYGNGDLLLN